MIFRHIYCLAIRLLANPFILKATLLEHLYMKKDDFVRDIAARLDESVSKADIKKVIDAYQDALEALLKNDDTITFPGFGTFKLRHSKERKGRNPQTGEEITIKASRTGAFSAGKSLKNM